MGKGWMRYHIERYGKLKVIVGIDEAGFVREVIYPDKPPFTPNTVRRGLELHWGPWKHDTKFLSASEFVEELENKLALLKELVQEG